MASGIENVLNVIDQATAKFERLFGNISKAEAGFGSLKAKAAGELAFVGKSVDQLAKGIGESFLERNGRGRAAC